MVFVPGTGALDKEDIFGLLTVRRPGDLAAFGHFLHLDIGDHVGELAVAQVFQFVGVIGFPTGGQDHRSDPFGDRRAVLGNGYVKNTRPAGDLLDLGRGKNLDIGFRLDLFDLAFQIDRLQFLVGRTEAFVHLVHKPAQGGFPFHQQDRVSGLGRAQGGIHAGKPAAHHQHGFA